MSVPRLPRPVLALGASLLLHLILVAALAGTAVVRGLARAPKVDMQLVAVDVKVDRLPLGPPPSPRAAPKPSTKPGNLGVRRPRPRGAVAVRADGGAPDAGEAPPDADRAPDVGPLVDAGRRDLKPIGPEGARLTAVLRLDRLREGPESAANTAAVDALLRLLPDRRRLLDGTGLDLYRDFDAVVIATPNPMDDAVTFLAARHHVKEPELKAALERGAATAGRPLRWRPDVDRPVATRAAREGRVERDDRLFVLPTPKLAVMAPPAYAALLIPGGDGGAAGWTDLATRIDAEEAAMPADAIVMLTGTNVVRGQTTVPGVGGLALPKVFSLVAGLAPTPLVELTGTMSDEAAARAWEDRWPLLHRDALANPLVLLSGFSSLVERLTLVREGDVITLRVNPTAEELRRLLLTIGNLAQAGAR